MNNEVLYRKRINLGGPSYQLVLPKGFRKSALEGLYDANGHMGMERTIDLVRTHFYWPRMAMDVNEKIRTCERCTGEKLELNGVPLR